MLFKQDHKYMPEKKGGRVEKGRAPEEGTGGEGLEGDICNIQLKQEKITLTRKLLILLSLPRNHFTSVSADTAMGQCPEFSGKMEDRND